MFARLLARMFLFVTSREALLVLGVFLALLSLPMILEQWRFVRDYTHLTATDPMIEEMEGIVDGLAGILVAAGVFMESRDTIRKMALPPSPASGHSAHEAASSSTTPSTMSDAVETRLNEVAHQNGMGILLVGLLMEIGTLLIGLPRRVIDAKAFERGIFGACFVLSVLALVILYDLVKDYLLTYRMKRDEPAISRRG